MKNLYAEITSAADVTWLHDNLKKFEDWSLLWQLTISVKNVIHCASVIAIILIVHICCVILIYLVYLLSETLMLQLTINLNALQYHCSQSFS
jgi:hypothetical protein